MTSNVNIENGGELYFSNLQCRTNKGKEILKGLSGKFPPASLIALMGPSGAGKTTLLNNLSAYNLQNPTYDSLLLNGVITNFDQLSRISCYITQDIHLNDLLSVEENMKFAADFKLGSTHSTTEKNDIITDLLDSFGLSSTRQTRAGKLSGGERKRLALALEMISDPSIIYLDEPTTGLDISTTNQILTYLKKIAISGKTVICTIHQVCASHFDLFDLAYVIANGQCAYQGRPQDLVPFLDEHGLPCNIYHNPADYLIELCCGDFGKEKASQLVKASQNGVSYIQRNNKQTLQSETIGNQCENASWSYQFQTLLRREYVKTRRNWVLTHLRFVGSNFLSLAIGLIFYNVGADATKVFFNYNLVMATCANLVLSGLLYPILSFPLQMDVIKREIHNRYYSILQYYISVSILDLPISLLTIVTSNMVIYYLSGQVLEKDRIVLFLIFSIALGTTVNALGFFYGTLLDLNNAVFFGSCTNLPLMSLSGFAIMPQDLPYFLDKLSQFIYARRGLQGLLVAVFGLESRPLPCSEEAEICIYKESHRFMAELRMDPYEYGSALFVLAAWYIAVRVITYFTMKYRLSILS